MNREVGVHIRSRAYILGLVAVVIYAAVNSFLAVFGPAWQPWFAISPNVRVEETYEHLTFIYFVPFITSLLVAALNKKNKFLNKSETLIVITMVLVPIWIPTYFGLFGNYAIAYHARASSTWFPVYEKLGHEIEYLFGPVPWDDHAKWEPFLYGGPVNWADWGIPTLFFLAWCIPFWLMSVFFAGIIRKQWIDVENLEFPLVTGITRMLDLAYERKNGKSGIFRNKYLWLGVLISVVASAPSWIHCLVPQLIFLRPWKPPGNPGQGRVAITWGWDLIPFAFLPWVPIIINLDPWMIGAAIFVPSTTLLSFIVFHFILFWVLPPIFVSLGIWDPMTTGKTETIIYNYVGVGTGPIGIAKWQSLFGGHYAWFSEGAIFGVWAIPLLITYRGELIKRLKAIIKPNTELEGTEPAKYRFMWLGFIICWLATSYMWWFASNGAANFIWVMLSLFGIWAIWTIQTARVAAEFGSGACMKCDTWGFHQQATFSQWAVYEGPFALPQKERFLALRGNLTFSWTIRGSPLISTLEMFKAAKITNTHPKRIFVAAIISVIVCAVVSAPVFLSTIHTFGIENLKPWMGAQTVESGPMRYNFYIARDSPTYKAGIRPVPGQWIAFAIGIAQTAIIMLLRSRFPWFPFNAAGAAIAWLLQPWAMFIPAIIAYIIKITVIKVGGLKMYENELLPLATGLIAGIGLMSVVSVVGVAANYITWGRYA